MPAQREFLTKRRSSRQDQAILGPLHDRRRIIPISIRDNSLNGRYLGPIHFRKDGNIITGINGGRRVVAFDHDGAGGFRVSEIVPPSVFNVVYTVLGNPRAGQGDWSSVWLPQTRWQYAILAHRDSTGGIAAFQGDGGRPLDEQPATLVLRFADRNGSRRRRGIHNDAHRPFWRHKSQQIPAPVTNLMRPLGNHREGGGIRLPDTAVNAVFDGSHPAPGIASRQGN